MTRKRDYKQDRSVKNIECENCGKKTGDKHENYFEDKVKVIKFKITNFDKDGMLRDFQYVCTKCQIEDAIQIVKKYRQVK